MYSMVVWLWLLCVMWTESEVHKKQKLYYLMKGWKCDWLISVIGNWFEDAMTWLLLCLDAFQRETMIVNTIEPRALINTLSSTGTNP